MTAAQLAEHFPERVHDAELDWGSAPPAAYAVPTREIRCACGWVCDAPESLTAKRWAEHVLQRTEASA